MFETLLNYLINGSIVMVIFLSLLMGAFTFFTSRALLFFPWWRHIIIGEGNPLTHHSLKFDNIEFKAFDSDHKIRGWWIPAKPDNDLHYTIIVVHGSGRDKYQYFDQIKIYNQVGLNVFIFDCRDGLGDIDQVGRGLGYSLREHKDVRAAIRVVRSDYPQQSKKIILTGMSMGAGSVLVAAGKDRDLIDGVIAEASYMHPRAAWSHNIYKNLREGVKAFKPVERFQAILPTNPPQMLIDIVTGFTMIKLLFSESNLSARDVPIEMIEKISPKPLLIIHSTADPVVPYSHAVQLYKAAKEPKELWTIDNEKPLHMPASDNVPPEEYQQRLVSFISKL
ncbi:hypothetical protein PPL_01643 [Heterostelium album PN500]|uniref:Serine aminopeptidase S33 domain-containing protein n=1 Tax=Heterostelium pallidum (strain ATCC 26659 / Pp 5 / PN500) TaxID=670386 RepID=D3B029_HETP5|nr:hypothetical protein PPL_01643 [Heterostelium album PN500]EFA84653.1 hypothetical protein PPL_01643 [Heterostelium album PN500]|eukprot:XP_020436766.1 hypothetical protein PPL_01643 [Heterostelium album PN500]